MRNTDPDRIYIENVRSFFNIPFFLAKLFCEMAVKEGYFEKRIALICPNNNCSRVIKSTNNEISIPNDLKCLNCEINEEDNFIFDKSEVRKVIYYRLKK